MDSEQKVQHTIIHVSSSGTKQIDFLTKGPRTTNLNLKKSWTKADLALIHLQFKLFPSVIDNVDKG